jgi:hypothetical protein
MNKIPKYLFLDDYCVRHGQDRDDMVFWSLGSWDLDLMDHNRSAYLVLICGVCCYGGGVKITFFNGSHILVIYALGLLHANMATKQLTLRHAPCDG